MMWVGTVDGLSRFDGRHFKNFKAGNDSSSFVNRYVIDLCEDKQGNIWGGTASGIFCYRTDKNSFITYIPPTIDFARGIKNIVCVKSGDIWATSEWNILKFNKQKNIFEEIGPLTTNKDSLGAYSVRQNGMVEDPSGKGIWFATRSGLHFYNYKEQKFYSHKNFSGNTLFTNHSVAALSLSVTGNFWFFDNVSKDIISFNPVTNTILQRINLASTIPGVIAQTIFEDSNNRIWFSTWNEKAVVIDYKKNIIVTIAYKNDNPLSIAGNQFWDVYEDNDNNIWLATSGGISKCNYSKNVYSMIPIVETVSQFKNNRLLALSIDPTDKSWWIASEGKVSIIQYFPESGSYHYYDFSKAVKNTKGQLPGPVYAIQFMDGQPYACTHTGIWKLKRGGSQIIPFEKDFNAAPAASFFYLVEHGNEVWFSAIDYIIKWDKLTNQSVKIRATVDTLPDGQRINYSSIYVDREGKCWFIPAFGWLGSITKNNKVVLKNYIKNKAKELSGYVTSITGDTKGNLWLTSAGVGLYKYNIEKGEMILYDQSDGILGFSEQVITDNAGNLWIASRNKFSVFNPETKSITYYKLPVYENTIDYGNIFGIDSSGAILVTFNEFVVKFMPDRLHLKPVLLQPLLSMIKISGKEKLLVDEKELNLEPDQNSLEFNFGSLISNEIYPYSFEYRLDGFDKNWISADENASALYNNLNSGKYVFRVRAVSKDKTWQTPERIITLNIRTPFYKAIWFWLLVGGLLVLTLIFFYRYRFNKQKQILTLETKAQVLEKEKTMVMYDSLKQQLNPHFLFNSLTSLSGLIETNQQMAGNFLEQMSGIYRYILKNGDNETVTVKEEISFVKLYISLQQTRFKKGLQINLLVPEEYQHYKIAPVTLQNLIENAIKHNIIDAESPLVIDVFIENDYIVVKNNLQKKSMVETSNKKGLAQFETLYKYLSEMPILIEETAQFFIIKIPLI